MSRKTAPATSAWKQVVAEHRKPALRSAVRQLGNSLIPYLALWGLMIWTLDISYWITRERRGPRSSSPSEANPT